MFVVISGIVTANKNVIESKWLKEFFSFNIPYGNLACETVLDLALTTEYGDLSQSSSMLKGVFSYYEIFGPLPQKKPRWWTIDTYCVSLLVLANKYVQLFVLLKVQ